MIAGIESPLDRCRSSQGSPGRAERPARRQAGQRLAPPALEVAGIFRGTDQHGASQCRPCQPRPTQVMFGDRNCRTQRSAAMVARCENEKCGYTQIAYNSCRNRHCPKVRVQPHGMACGARAELLPVPYFHVVFSLPAQIADIAYHNKAVIYDILFKASGRDMITSRPIPSTLAPAWCLSILHTWGSALTPPSTRPHDRARRRHLA